METLLVNLAIAIIETVREGINAQAATEAERQARLAAIDAKLAARLALGPIPPV